MLTADQVCTMVFMNPPYQSALEQVNALYQGDVASAFSKLDAETMASIENFRYVRHKPTKAGYSSNVIFGFTSGGKKHVVKVSVHEWTEENPSRACRDLLKNIFNALHASKTCINCVYTNTATRVMMSIVLLDRYGLYDVVTYGIRTAMTDPARTQRKKTHETIKNEHSARKTIQKLLQLGVEPDRIVVLIREEEIRAVTMS